MPKSYEILLPSFVRRVNNACEIKASIRSLGCVLQRKGRSRHWLLTASFEQLEQVIELIHISQEPSWQWVAKQINKHKQTLTHDELINIAHKQPGITVNQLMLRTDCTIAEARLVIDELEDFN